MASVMADAPAYRLLVTASRTWTNARLIGKVLAEVHAEHPDAVLVSGHASRGGDAIAERAWARLCGYAPAAAAIAAGRIEVHEALWGRYGHRAGPLRNSGMTAAGGDELVAFIMPCRSGACRRPEPHDTHGTADCLAKAKAAGIPCREFRLLWLPRGRTGSGALSPRPQGRPRRGGAGRRPTGRSRCGRGSPGGAPRSARAPGRTGAGSRR